MRAANAGRVSAGDGRGRSEGGGLPKAPRQTVLLSGGGGGRFPAAPATRWRRPPQHPEQRPKPTAILPPAPRRPKRRPLPAAARPPTRTPGRGRRPSPRKATRRAEVTRAAMRPAGGCRPRPRETRRTRTRRWPTSTGRWDGSGRRGAVVGRGPACGTTRGGAPGRVGCRPVGRIKVSMESLVGAGSSGGQPLAGVTVRDAPLSHDHLRSKRVGLRSERNERLGSDTRRQDGLGAVEAFPVRPSLALPSADSESVRFESCSNFDCGGHRMDTVGRNGALTRAEWAWLISLPNLAAVYTDHPNDQMTLLSMSRKCECLPCGILIASQVLCNCGIYER